MAKALPVETLIKYPTVVIYGPSGAGKTSVSASANKPVFLDSNQGLLSIYGRPGLEHVHGVDVTSVTQLDDAYNRCTGTLGKKKDWSKKYGTIVFDHFNDIQAIVMEELGDKRKARDDRKDEDEAEQRDYGIMGNKLRRLIRKFKHVPMVKILICGEKEDRESGRMMPDMIGALKGQLPYFADHTMYLRIGKKGKRYLHLDSTDEFYAKTRAWWFTPEQRKIVVPFDDTKFLTNLFALIAAGPKGNSNRGKNGE